MVLQNLVEDTHRSKKKFTLSQTDFFKGAWLDDLKHLTPFDKIDITYKNGFLVASFYSKQIREVDTNGNN